MDRPYVVIAHIVLADLIADLHEHVSIGLYGLVRRFTPLEVWRTLSKRRGLMSDAEVSTCVWTYVWTCVYTCV